MRSGMGRTTPARLTIRSLPVTGRSLKIRPVLTRDEIGNGRGLENTLLVVEAADAVPWTRPIDLVNVSGHPLPRLGGRFYGESGLGGVYYLCTLFADGSTRYFTEEDEDTIRALISWKR